MARDERSMVATNPDPGSEPDYRFTLANERTFLAWMRTCLGLLAAAVAVVQFAPDLGSQGFRESCGIALGILATASAAGGLWRWLVVQAAMRHERPLRRGGLPVALSVGLAVVSVAVVVTLVVALAR